MSVQRLMLYVFLAGTLAVPSCLRERPAHSLDEIRQLKGKGPTQVTGLLGSPKVIDSSSVAGERIWGYYQVPIVSSEEEEPRQRTVLIVFRKQDGTLRVDEVRVP